MKTLHIDPIDLCHPNHACCPDHWSDCDDARKFAKLLSNPSPLTEEALRELGFEFDTGMWFCKVAVGEVQAVDTNGTWKVYLYDDAELCGTSVTTIGALRSLLFALGGKLALTFKEEA